MANGTLLLIGEIFVDFTLATNERPVKMRLGGVVHAARGLWASGIAYAVAAVCPDYLIVEAERFLIAHGCVDFFVIGIVDGAPNVVLVADEKEVGHQGYEDILRDARKVRETPELDKIGSYEDIVIFPGTYSLKILATHINPSAYVTVDAAYGIESAVDLNTLSSNIQDITLSTSSSLFMENGSEDVSVLTEMFKPIASRLLLKENRGGSRLFDLKASRCEEIYASLGETTNSVGVGDVYTAVFASSSRVNRDEAVWRGMQAATRYAQTTFPDDFKRDVQRDLQLSIERVRALGGVTLPWHERPKFEIYLAAPDFTYVDRTEIEAAVAALKYHNFIVRRPVIENGEAERGSSSEQLFQFYFKDVALLQQCAIIFAVPLQRDPGTLIEMGMAMAHGIPVVTFDPRNENKNTMVMCGSNNYSADLSESINATFESISKLREDSN